MLHLRAIEEVSDQIPAQGQTALGGATFTR